MTTINRARDLLGFLAKENWKFMDKKVAVLISTYNGEKYLAEQLDSILSQTYQNIEIVIRDDGSKDSTIAIIEGYQKKHSNILLEKGENVGFLKSFFSLLQFENADYYAFCDQDDIWVENKVELAVEALSKADETKPNMVFGNSDYYDENMNFVRKGEEHKTFSFRNSLYECVAQGMTMTINETARRMILEHIPEKCLFHDWWTYMICSGNGNVFYNDVTTVKYRRLAKSATAEGQNVFKIFWWRIKKLLAGSGTKDIKAQQLEYKKMFYTELSAENQKILDVFVQEKYHFLKAIRKAFYPRRLRRKLVDEVMVRILFIFGII